jgi:hypothetical protein
MVTIDADANCDSSTNYEDSEGGPYIMMRKPVEEVTEYHLAPFSGVFSPMSDPNGITRFLDDRVSRTGLQ